MGIILKSLGGYLLTINMISFATFGWDKLKAKLNMNRISENELLYVS